MEEVVNRLRHRGPDDHGAFFGESRSGPVCLVSTRLAIRDLSANGHMPMVSDDGTIAIAYNGELYDTDELEQAVRRAGLSRHSTTDTELVLRSYEMYGPRCVDHLDGMFAFTIWDARNEQMFFARDHFGVKPLYYSLAGPTFVCSSEIKAMLAVPGFSAELDPVSLQQYLTFLWVPDPRTMFKGVHKLEAGHCGVFRNGTLSTWKYWDLEFPPAVASYPESEADLIAEFTHLFDDSVRRQMVSDVPVGSFLSAGLDSSSIVASMARYTSDPIKTYTVAFPSSRKTLTLDDTAVAARTARHFGCDHHQIDADPAIADLLPKVVWHLDEPIADPAAIAAYLVNEEARKKVTVLMSGVGGDELMGGYRKHVAQRQAHLYRRMPPLLTDNLLPKMADRMPSLQGTRYADHMRLVKKMVRSGALPSDDMFIRNSTYFTQEQLQTLLRPEVRSEIGESDPWERHRRHFDQVRDADELNRMLYLDTKAFMVSLNLTYNDKMSMANSTEVRVPFLDRRLVEFLALRVPPSMKLRYGRKPVGKYLLRKSMHGRLPEEVFTQRKAGFGAPVAEWLRGDLSEMVHDTLLGPGGLASQWLDPTAMRSVVDGHDSGHEDFSLQIWAMLSLEIWADTFGVHRKQLA